MFLLDKDSVRGAFLGVSARKKWLYIARRVKKKTIVKENILKKKCNNNHNNNNNNIKFLRGYFRLESLAI